MKQITLTVAAMAMSLLFSFKTVEPSTWALDKAHAKIGFTITHLMVSEVEGNFKTFDATITASKEDFSDAVVEMKAETNSISTDNEQRDTHLKSADFFDVIKYPSLTFKSKSFKKEGPNNYKVTGDFTMHGITKSITLDAVCKMGTNPMSKKTIAGFKVTGIVKRSDFGIASGMASAMLGDEVTITANAEFAKN